MRALYEYCTLPMLSTLTVPWGSTYYPAQAAIITIEKLVGLIKEQANGGRVKGKTNCFRGHKYAWFRRRVGPLFSLETRTPSYRRSTVSRIKQIDGSWHLARHRKKNVVSSKFTRVQIHIWERRSRRICRVFFTRTNSIEKLTVRYQEGSLVFWACWRWIDFGKNDTLVCDHSVIIVLLWTAPRSG